MINTYRISVRLKYLFTFDTDDINDKNTEGNIFQVYNKGGINNVGFI